jgi:hypothetical protein
LLPTGGVPQKVAVASQTTFPRAASTSTCATELYRSVISSVRWPQMLRWISPSTDALRG